MTRYDSKWPWRIWGVCCVRIKVSVSHQDQKLQQQRLLFIQLHLEWDGAACCEMSADEKHKGVCVRWPLLHFHNRSPWWCLFCGVSCLPANINITQISSYCPERSSHSTWSRITGARQTSHDLLREENQIRRFVLHRDVSLVTLKAHVFISKFVNAKIMFYSTWCLLSWMSI